MGADQANELMAHLLWSCLMIAAPVVVAVMLVGLIVSVFQVATQLQEMTLGYVPKLLVATVVLIAIGPWMIHRITQFAIDTIRLIPLVE